jgi:site-specific DNA-methyltransferase (cytosine-N4-specific)
MKYVDASWDFRQANTKTVTHCYHAYPAMMIPQVASRLLERYGHGCKWLFDPYCGTGTSLVEANLIGINAIGTDLNPLARLIAKTKTTRISLQMLDLYLKAFSDFAFQVMFDLRGEGITMPEITNMDFWFDKLVQEELAVIKKFIADIDAADIRDFFYVAFSETVRESSYTRNGEFKLFRMTAEQMQKFSPDVFGLMNSKLARNRKGLKSFIEQATSAYSLVYSFNTVHEIRHIEPESIDIVLTSPPYGDSRTTVAYGQFSRLANEWLGVSDANQIDNQLMGGKRRTASPKFESQTVMETLEKISVIDSRRADEVASFYHDYRQSIQNVSGTLKSGGYACYVVGNRRVKGVTLPTDIITQDFFECNGFRHIETIIRIIPNKRMPSKNSPTNAIGVTDETMTQEFIVVMQKN